MGEGHHVAVFDDLEPRLFLSCRREDLSRAVVGRLVDALRRPFPVFWDGAARDAAGHGLRRIDRQLDRAPLVLVLITPSWVGDPRFLEEDDLLRHEVEYAVEHGIAFPIYVGMDPLSRGELAEVGLEDLYADDACRFGGRLEPDDDLDHLRRAIAVRLAMGAVGERTCPPDRAAPAIGPDVRGARAALAPAAWPPPAWRVDADWPVGAVVARSSPCALVLIDDVLGLEGEGVCSRIEVPGATSAVVTADGRSTVVGGDGSLWLVPIGPESLGPPTLTRCDDADQVVGAWRGDDDVVVARRTDGTGPGLVRIERGRVRPAPGSPSGRTWVAAGGTHRDGWAAVRDDGELDGEGAVVAALRAHSLDGWMDLDVAWVTMPVPMTLVVGLQVRGGAGTLVVARLGSGAPRWSGGAAVGPVWWGRTDSADEATIVRGRQGELAGWPLDALVAL